MKKTAYYMNTNTFVSYCVENKKALQLFTPKAIGKPTAICIQCEDVLKSIYIPKHYLEKKEIETGGDFQLDDASFLIVVPY